MSLGKIFDLDFTLVSGNSLDLSDSIDFLVHFCEHFDNFSRHSLAQVALDSIELGLVAPSEVSVETDTTHHLKLVSLMSLQFSGIIV